MKSRCFLSEKERNSFSHVDAIQIKTVKNNVVTEETYIHLLSHGKVLKALQIAEQEIQELKGEIRRMKISKILDS